MVLDSTVKADVSEIVSAVNLFYIDTKTLPRTLEKIKTLPSLSFFKLKNNPITGKPYVYVIKAEGKGYTASGTLTDGSEFKMDIPL